MGIRSSFFFFDSRYDNNLLKTKLAKCLELHHEKRSFVVKKNNAYMCIATPTLKFLDVAQYLAPGCSYENFLKCYDTLAQKQYFCYEYITSPDVLYEQQLPPIDAFFSTLKGYNVLESPERRRFQELRSQGLTEQQTLVKMQLSEPPATKEQIYATQQKLWDDNGYQYLHQYLESYNKADVQPFVEAVETMMSFYWDKGVDLFKSTISAPGVARSLLFKSAGPAASFALMEAVDSDLYDKIRRNIIGIKSIALGLFCCCCCCCCMDYNRCLYFFTLLCTQEVLPLSLRDFINPGRRQSEMDQTSVSPSRDMIQMVSVINY